MCKYFRKIAVYALILQKGADLLLEVMFSFSFFSGKLG